MALIEPDFSQDDVEIHKGADVGYTVHADFGGPHLEAVTLILNRDVPGGTTFWDKHVVRKDEKPSVAYIVRNTENNAFHIPADKFAHYYETAEQWGLRLSENGIPGGTMIVMDKTNEKQVAFDLAKGIGTVIKSKAAGFTGWIGDVIVEFKSSCIVQFIGNDSENLTEQSNLKKMKLGVRVQANSDTGITVLVVHCAGPG